MVKLSANFSGVMDRDSDDRYIHKGNYRTLKNGIIDRDDEGGRFLVKNLRSSKFIADIPVDGKLVGYKEYKDYFYQFYYDSNTNIFSLYRVNPHAENDYTLLFEHELRDEITESIPSEEIPTQAGADFWNNFLLADVGGSPALCIYNNLHVIGEVAIDSSETSGDAFVDEDEFNNYFRLINQNTSSEAVICNVPIVCTGEITFDTTPSTLNDFSNFNDFKQYVTIKNKGLSNEYIVVTIPLYVKDNIVGYSTESFSNGIGFSFDEDPENPDEVTRVIEYKPIERINFINFIENQSNGDLLCYFTDGVNPPFKINITWLLEGNQYNYIRDICVAKLVPPEPKIVPYHDYSLGLTNDDIFQFATRYVYKDGEKTPLSTYSKAAFYPQLENELSGISNVVGYYITDGTLYQISGLDDSTAVSISSGYDTNYDRVVSSNDGSVVYLYSTQASLPVLYSTNGGYSFKESLLGEDSFAQAFVDMVCSADGKYSYICVANDLYRSTNYGETYERIYELLAIWDAEHIDQVSCSSDGSVVAVAQTIDDEDQLASDTDYYHKFEVFTNYGDNRIWSDFSGDYDFTQSHIVSVSPNGNYVAIVLDTNIRVLNVSTSNIISSINASSGISAIGINDNGYGWADGYYTEDFFKTLNAFDNFDDVYVLSDGVILKNGTTYTRYNLYNNPIESGNIDFIPSLVNGVDNVSIIGNIHNFFNAVDIWIDKPNKYVEKVEVYAIRTDDQTAYLIKELENNEDNFPDGEEGVYVTFKNNLIYRVLSDTERSVLFSNVPLVAKTQELIGNRLFYGNYIDGRDLPNPDFSVELTIDNNTDILLDATIQSNESQLSLSTSNAFTVNAGDAFELSFTYNGEDGNIYNDGFKHIFTNNYSTWGEWESIGDELNKSFKSLFPNGSVTTTDTGTEYVILFDTGDSNITFVDIFLSAIVRNNLTYKKGDSFKIGIVYYDEYNRGSYPIFSDSEVDISDNINDKDTRLRVTINHTPPEWAVKYKFVRTDRDLNYRLIAGFSYVTVLNGLIYLMKREGESYTPDAGTYLEVHDADGILRRMQVISKETKEADFVEGSPAGDWITVKPLNISGLSVSDVLNNASLFNTSVFYTRENLDVEENLLYYEIPGVYYIADGYHLGNIQSQDENTESAIVELREDANAVYLSDYNIEVNFTSSGSKFWNCGRALLDADIVGEVNRYSSITWSDLFVQETGHNGLSMFNQGTINWKNLEVSNGAINSMKALDTNLNIWQTDGVGYVLVNKNAIVTSTGESAITSSDKVAGDYVQYSGEYGTIHPESVVSYGNVRYFVDTKRDCICRIGQEGISEISGNLMSSFFRNILDKDDRYIGIFNVDQKEYWIYSEGQQTIYVYDEKGNGWTRFITPVSLNGMLQDDKNVFTISDGMIYSQMAGEDYGVINGNNVDFEFEYVQNEEPGIIKVYKTSELESNKPIETIFYIGGSYNSYENFNESIVANSDYETREGEYFAYIPPIANYSLEGLNDYNEGGTIVPLGIISSVNSNTITLKSNIHQCIGEANHAIFVVDTDGTPIYRGKLNNESNIGVNTITSTENFDSSDVDKFVFLVENSYINGHNLRAPFVRVKFVDSDNDKVAIFAHRIEVIESKNQ